MRKSLLSIATASMFVAGIGLACAQSETPSQSMWNANQGQVLEQYSTTMHYQSYSDPAMNPAVGMDVPGTVSLYPLPDTMQVPDATTYRYGMINGHPVVVQTTTRKVVHTWN